MGVGLGVYLLARAAMKKYHKLDDLASRDLSSHSSGGCTSKIKVSEESVPSESYGGEFVLCFSM